MSFPRYPTYKDSGVEWLGEVPEHWDVAPLKRGFSVTLGKMLQQDSSGPDDELLPYLRAANIQWDGVDVSDIKQMWLSPRDREQLTLQPGDLLVSEGGDVGRSCMWAGEVDNCSFQNSVNRVRSIDGGSTRFLYYWMSTIKDKGYVDVLCNKSTIAHFTAEKVAAVPVPLPPNEEQRGVAEFLDHETAKIDALVAEQERLIELLKEKRQAVISHAVTKGLNPSVPMKDSGVEWLGEVPSHWHVGRVKQFFATTSGSTPQTDRQDIYYNGEIPWIRSLDLTDGEITEWEIGITPAAIEDTACKVLPIGTVLVAMYGGDGTIGKNGLLRVTAATNQAICAILPSPQFDPAFVLAFMQHQRPYWMVGAEGTRKDPNISQDRVRNAVVPCPPLAEQEAISEHLRKAVSAFSSLEKEADTAIRLLSERRTTLISAAVTGQIDVRGWTPPTDAP